MERWKGRVALVTGASAGIGMEICRQLVERGEMIVVGVSNKDVEKIELLSKELSDAGRGGQLIGLKCDVRIEDDILSVYEYIKNNYSGVDVCINNAGLAHKAPLCTGNHTEQWREMLEVNVLGAAIVGREFIKDIKRREVDDGHLIYMCSMSGHRVPVGGVSSDAFYCATKYAVSALVEGTRQELREMKSNCRITAISPALVRTEFKAHLEKAKDIEESKRSYNDLVYNGQVLEVEDIASAIIYSLTVPQRIEINDILIRPTAQID